MVRSQILSIILFVALAVVAVAAQVKLHIGGWAFFGLVLVLAAIFAGVAALLGKLDGGASRGPAGPVAAEVVRTSAPAPLEGEMTVVAAARVRSRTDVKGLLGQLWLLDAGGVVVAIRDPLADELAKSGRFPAETVSWTRNDGGALTAIDARGEARRLVWDVEAPGAIEVSDGEVLEARLEEALERASGLAVSGGRQVL